MNAKAKAQKVLELKDHVGYAAAMGALERLEKSRLEAVRQVDLMKTMSSRQSQEVRLFISRGARAMANMDEVTLKRITSEIIASSAIPPKIMTEARAGTPAISLSSKSDTEIAVEFQEKRVAVELFECAINLHKKEVARQKEIACAEIVESIKPEYQGIARGLANASVQMAAALRDYFSFIERLKRQIYDDAFPAGLLPGAFPLTSPSDPKTIEWAARALDITRQQAEHLLVAAGGESPREIS